MTAASLSESPVVTIPPPLALTLDLDDTLWPVWPVIDRAEQVLHDWLVQRAPATARRFDTAALRALRNAIAERHPEWGHDLGWPRRESLREALVTSGDDPALAAEAFDVFFDARQRVVLYDDAADALARLAARFPLVAVTNGNADLVRVGLADRFLDSISASRLGVSKPHPRMFQAACERLGVGPADVLHVGDDLMLDVDGALGAGLRAVWLRRGPALTEAAPQLSAPYHVFGDLAQLADALGC